MAPRGRNAKHRSAIIPNLPVNATNTAEVHGNPADDGAPSRISWARLFKRVFDIDIEKCPHCGGTLKIIAAIENSAMIAKILAHLACPPGPRPPAREAGNIPVPRFRWRSGTRPWPWLSIDSKWPDLKPIADSIRFSP